MYVKEYVYSERFVNSRNDSLNYKQKCMTININMITFFIINERTFNNPIVELKNTLLNKNNGSTTIYL